MFSYQFVPKSICFSSTKAYAEGKKSVSCRFIFFLISFSNLVHYVLFLS